MTQEEFEQLQVNCQPHPVLNKDFMRYYPLSFANAFLPKAPLLQGKGYEVYDGAAIFSGLQSDTGLFELTDKKQQVSIIVFTYTIGVEAESKKDRVMASENELVIFIEMNADSMVEVHFRFGREFRGFLEAAKQSPSSLEGDVYSMTADELRARLFSEPYA